MKNKNYALNLIAMTFSFLQTDEALQILSFIITGLSVLVNIIIEIKKYIDNKKELKTDDINNICDIIKDNLKK